MSSSILVLGATGASGLAFIQVALGQANPPKLTLFVRPGSSGKLPAGIEKQTRVVEGNLTDEPALLDAMDGVDTVVSLLGAYASLSALVFRTTSTVCVQFASSYSTRESSRPSRSLSPIRSRESYPL
jgi:uncharacterized protein YbjT (DUF2867 family)